MKKSDKKKSAKKEKIISKTKKEKTPIKTKSSSKPITQKINPKPKKPTHPKNTSKKSSPQKTSIKPTPKKSTKISTGVDGLDKITEGGFEKNSTNLIIGNTGAGKSIFGIQFLIEGIKNGEKGLYITFEEKKEDFYKNMLNLGFDLEEYEKKEQFFFLEYTPGKVKTMLEEGGGIIESIVLRRKISRVVIDSMSSFELLFENDLEKRESELTLFSMLRKWNCTTIITYEQEPTRNIKLESRVLEFESDSLILLYFVRQKEQRERYLEVLKMKGTNHSKGIHNFQIEKKGIKLNTKNFSKEIYLEV